MSYGLSSTERDGEILARACNKTVRAFDVKDKPFPTLEAYERPFLPQDDFILPTYKWVSGKDLFDVSAIAVATAVLTAEKKDVPVGVIVGATGGLSIETFLPRECVEADEAELAFLKSVGRYADEENYNNCGIRNFTQLSGVYNEKIAPIKGFSLSGVIWYLGESSALDFDFAVHYKNQLVMLVKEYRKLFGEAPFALVHIAPEYYYYGDGNGYVYINEAMTDAAEAAGNCFVAGIYDIEPRWLRQDGDLYYHPIHPVNKYPVSKRIADALCAEAQTCPKISRAEFCGNKAVCTVSGGKGLKKGKEFFGFTLAGKGGKYFPATAVATDKNRIEVSCDDVIAPENLTYAFCQYQEYCDAKDIAGNPLLPFRTAREPVNENYFSLPPYLFADQPYVTENCFGYNVGISRKIPAWSSGVIYDQPVKISRGKIEKTLKISAEPQNKYYFFFGASPNICLSGRKHHLDNFEYLELDISATEKCEFYGLAVRTSDGECKRFAPLNGTERTESVVIGKDFSKCVLGLGEWLGEDAAPSVAGKAERKNIVQAQLLFRCKNPVTVSVSRMRLRDVTSGGFSTVEEKPAAPERDDTRLMK